MADSNCLRVIFIFEAGAKLSCGSELLCLACHLYHRFYRVNQELTQYDMYTFGAACIQLASWFYELPVSADDLALVMASVAHGSGTDTVLTKENKVHVARSIALATKVVAINLDFQINYKDTRMLTPREVLAGNQRLMAEEVIEIDRDSTEEEQEEEEKSRLLVRNKRHLISSHRYLIHYLKAINSLIPSECSKDYNLICNIAWSYLSDFHWVAHVTQHYSNHLACACLKMAIETCKPDLMDSTNSNKLKLWSILNKKWNLILCDDFSQEKLDRLIGVIVGDYLEYERVMQHEFSTYVIDPKSSN